ncbi:MAG: UvrD-helicase domain-containing protein [Chloroflexi bacterium]|nr:UvrD-helicase domain-containing protein [Chloroflexota bacterium]
MNRSLLDDLNPPQREAVETVNGPVLILAGAGSGKTRVLTYRVANLVLNHHVRAENILAVTFTNKAANEMKERVAQLIGGVPFSMGIGTFHSICTRLLRREIGVLGWDSRFTIADDSQQETAIKSILRELGIDEKRFTPGSILGRISAAKNELTGPEEYARKADGLLAKIVADVYPRYQDRLRRNNSLDFDDLLTFAVRLFQESPETLARYRDRWRYVLVDEYQDTNHVQYVFTKLLAAEHHNICVVGDDDQSIYSWRGANIRNILDFEQDYPETKVIKLEQNYRSTQTILDVAHAVIQENAERKDKKLWTENGKGAPVAVQFMPNDFEEGRFVVREIRRLLSRHEISSLNEVAILYRTNAQSRLVERAFAEERIPYQVVGGPKFYERREIRDLLAYLRLISNPADDSSLRRIINVPPRAIGDTSLDHLQRFANQHSMPLWRTILEIDDVPGLQARAVAAFKGFRSMMLELMEASLTLPLVALLEQILKSTNYREYINPDGSLEGLDRMENVGSLLAQAAALGEGDPRETLAQFLDEVALVSDQDTLLEREDAATLITLHAAKGLEFPVVFIVGMSENIFPHRRVAEEPKQLEEERRLCYVGMTRAKQRLYLVHANQRGQYGGLPQESTPSRFFLSMPAELLTSPYGQDRGASAPGRWGRRDFAPRQRFNSDDDDWPPKPRWEQGELIRAGGHGQTGSRHRWQVDVTRPPAWEPPKAPVISKQSFHAGSRVRHAKFGNGVVVRSDLSNGDEEVTIAFDGFGIKKLSAAFAQLEHVG